MFKFLFKYKFQKKSESGQLIKDIQDMTLEVEKIKSINKKQIIDLIEKSKHEVNFYK